MRIFALALVAGLTATSSYAADVAMEEVPALRYGSGGADF